MGLLDDVLHKLGGAEGQGGGAGALMNLINNSPGGLQGLLSNLDQAGLGNQVQSWLGLGTNEPVSADQVKQALGDDQVQQLVNQAGVAPEELSQQVAQVLPQVVDQASPDGKLAAEQSLTPDAFLRPRGDRQENPRPAPPDTSSFTNHEAPGRPVASETGLLVRVVQRLKQKPWLGARGASTRLGAVYRRRRMSASAWSTSEGKDSPV